MNMFLINEIVQFLHINIDAIKTYLNDNTEGSQSSTKIEAKSRSMQNDFRLKSWPI